MFLPNATLLSIVDLNYDCLFHIFSHLTLSDLLNLRLQCSTLSDAVNKFLPHLGTLSIVYTEDHALNKVNSDGLSSLRCYHERGLSIVEENYREAGYSKSFNYWIDKTCKDIYRSRFRREDFMIISGRQKYETFLQFLKKYDIRAIKTLALFIDPECRCKIDYPMLSAVCMLLELCPKVESLFLERTYRVYCDSELEEPKQLGSFINSISRVETDCLSSTIAKLSSLNELHYFALRNSRVACLIIPNSWLSLGVQNNNLENFGHFLSTMFKKLGVFSYRIEAGGSHLMEIRGQTIENILELCLKDGDFEQLMKSGTKFPNLRSLTLTGGLQNFGRLNIGNSLEQLTSLQFCKHVSSNFHFRFMCSNATFFLLPSTVILDQRDHAKSERFAKSQTADG